MANETIKINMANKPGKLKAFVSVLYGSFKLDGMTVIEGVNGLFVSYPPKRDNKGEILKTPPNDKGKQYTVTHYYIPNTEKRKTFEDQVIEKYQEAIRNDPERGEAWMKKENTPPLREERGPDAENDLPF